MYMKKRSNKVIPMLIATTLLIPTVSFADSGNIINIKTDINGDIDTSLVKTNLTAELKSTSSNNSIVNVNVNGTSPVININTSSQVNSDADLNVFTNNIEKSNSNVASVDTSSGKVTVEYAHKGKLLGLFEVTINSETTIDTEKDGEIQTSLSWWSFLVSDVNYDQTTLESSLKNNTAIKSYAKADATAKAKAIIAETLVAELEVNSAASLK